MRYFTNLVLAAGAAALASCSKAPTPAPATAEPRALAVFYTCDTRGNIHACDCTGGSAGGIARRSSYLKDHATGDHLLVDAGNVGAGPGARDLIDLDAILEGYRRMGYDAINAGRGEAVLGLDELRARAAVSPRLLSANLTDEQGLLVLPTHVTRVMTNGLRVAIAGVVDPSLVEHELGAGLRVKAPADALSTLLPDLRARHDVVIVLAYMEQAAMIDLAALFYEIDAIIGGAVTQPTVDPLLVNRTVLTAITDRGKSIGRLELTVANGRTAPATNDITMLYDAVPDDPAMRDILDAHARRLFALTNAASADIHLEGGLQALPRGEP